MRILALYDPRDFPDGILYGEVSDTIERIAKHLAGCMFTAVPIENNGAAKKLIFDSHFVFAIVRRPLFGHTRFWILKNRHVDPKECEDEVLHSDQLYDMLIKEHRLWQDQQNQEDETDE